jgi:hypothetical protein
MALALTFSHSVAISVSTAITLPMADRTGLAGNKLDQNSFCNLSVGFVSATSRSAHHQYTLVEQESSNSRKSVSNVYDFSDFLGNVKPSLFSIGDSCQ